MDIARWQRIQALFHEALEGPESDRHAFVQAVCADDPSLLAQVLALLKKDSGESLLDRGVSGLAQQIAATIDDPLPFHEFGPYSIDKLLGEGGMGVVYLAHRKDTRNPVAIKFVRGAALSPARAERFKDEQSTLASLIHPYIARFYDAGVLDNGTPWFAMEYVEGMALNEYSRGLGSAAERLRLFRLVCEAVQYAHGRAIVHRDLKPTNILVRQDGTPRLLDFGIARQLENPEQAVDRAVSGLSFLTPAYAAPEQVRGESVGIYSDVYSLGVILYEMLTGQLPRDRWIDPEKPSALAARNGLANLRGREQPEWSDLDALGLKAMRPEVEQRYQSAGELIEEIDRCLTSRPLKAGPRTRRYRVARFLKRNRTPFASAAAVLVLLVSVIAVYTWQLRKARDKAQEEAKRSQAINEFMQSMLKGGSGEEAGPAKDLKVSTLLDRATKDAQGLQTDPKVQADLYATLGSVYQALGQFDRADSLLNTALQMRRRLFGSHHEEVADILVRLASLRINQARVAEAEDLVRTALAMNKRHLKPDDPAIVRSTIVLGEILDKRGDYRASINVLQDAIKTLTRNGSPQTALSEAYTALANTYHHVGDYARADSFTRQALDIDSRLLGASHPSVAEDLINLCIIQGVWEHAEQGEKYCRQALVIQQNWYGKGSPQAADAVTYLARSLDDQGRYDEEEQVLNGALTVLEQANGKMHPTVAALLAELGNLAGHRGRHEESAADYIRMKEIYEAAYGHDHQYTATALADLTMAYYHLKKYALAEAACRDALQRFRNVLAPEHPNLAITEIKLGHVLIAEQRYRDAETPLLNAHDTLAKQADASPYWTEVTRKDLVKVYDALKQPEKAGRLRAELAAAAAAKPKQAGN